MRRKERYLAKFDKYRITNHGDNPWTPDALANVAITHDEFEAARRLIAGEFTSVYRCERINKIVGGAQHSRHLRGLACDIKPGWCFTPDAAAWRLYEASISGSLGLAKQVISEPSWVHISWYSIDETDRGVTLLRKRDGSPYQRLKTWHERTP